MSVTAAIANARKKKGSIQLDTKVNGEESLADAIKRIRGNDSLREGSVPGKMPSKVPSAVDNQMVWRQAEKTYSGGKWADRVHGDGSRYYRSPNGQLYKIWDNGARVLKRGSRR